MQLTMPPLIYDIFWYISIVNKGSVIIFANKPFHIYANILGKLTLHEDSSIL